MTYSYVKLTVSAAAYDEIRALLLKAGYTQAVMESGALDMHGIALVRGSEEPDIQPLPYIPVKIISPPIDYWIPPPNISCAMPKPGA